MPLNFTWRKSILHEKKLIAISCIFDFPSNNRVDVKEIQNKSKKIMIHRKTFQESDLPNLGSIFATKNIYKELSKVNIYFFLLYLINKVGTFIMFKFFKSKIRNYRKKIMSLYAKSLNLEKFKKFSVSEKTLNCLINKGSSEASEAIELLKLFESKTKQKTVQPAAPHFEIPPKQKLHHLNYSMPLFQSRQAFYKYL